MNLAQDLLRKSSGYIHQMPKSIKQPKAAKAGLTRKPNTDTKYLDEDGQPAYRGDIAIKYGVSEAKVRDLFNKYHYEEVYRLISTDLRSKNGQGKIYALPCGEWASSQAVADFYGVSRSVIQRAWTAHDKCPIKSNEYLMDRFFTH